MFKTLPWESVKNNIQLTNFHDLGDKLEYSKLYNVEQSITLYKEPSNSIQK